MEAINENDLLMRLTIYLSIEFYELRNRSKIQMQMFMDGIDASLWAKAFLFEIQSE